MTTRPTPQATPIFVLGSPRSGTTLMGNYLATCPSVVHLGEYFGFYVAYHGLPTRLKGVPSLVTDEYLSSVEAHAAEFASGVAKGRGCDFYCDSTPWNLLIASYLKARFPDAIFVLMLRHYSGVIQSLTRSYRDGFEWAGASIADRAKIWETSYRVAPLLSQCRTVTVSYDELCASPERTIASFVSKLSAMDSRFTTFDASMLSISHATTQSNRRNTIGTVGDDGTLQMQPMMSFDPSTWTDEMEKEVSSIVTKTHLSLRRAFPGTYVEPNGFSKTSSCHMPDASGYTAPMAPEELVFSEDACPF